MVKIDKSLSSWSLHFNEVVEGKTFVNHSNPFIAAGQSSEEGVLGGGVNS